jgi:hypothetical protein
MSFRLDDEARQALGELVRGYLDNFVPVLRTFRCFECSEDTLKSGAEGAGQGETDTCLKPLGIAVVRRARLAVVRGSQRLSMR